MIRRRVLLEGHHLTEREEKNLRLLELIRQRGPMTRTELSHGTGLNIVTVSNYVADFIKRGLVVERGFDVSTGGRKPMLVELNAKAGYVIGVDLKPMGSAHTMTGIITDLRGTIIHQIGRRREVDSMEEVLGEGAEMIRELIKTSPIDSKKILGMAMGVSGVVDERAGTVRDTSHQGMRTSYLAFQDQLEGEFKKPILIGNDATFAGYGEYRLGLDRSVENMVYLYSDVGASLIIHGHVYWGSCGSAGEVGVLLPSSEDYLTWIKSPSFVLSNVWDLGLPSQAKKFIHEGHATSIQELAQGEIDAINLNMVIQAAQDGDQLARELLEHAAMQLGIRIAYFVNLLNPEVVIIGGGIEKAGSLLLEPVWRAVKKYAHEEMASLVDVLPAQLGENGVALGAACWVIQDVFIQAEAIRSPLTT